MLPEKNKMKEWNLQ